MRIQKLDSHTKRNLLEDLLKRSPNQYGEYEAGVARILEDVRIKGDEALFAYTETFDHASINEQNIQVTEEEIREAYELAGEDLVSIIRKALANIQSYHEKQRQYSWFDSKPDGTILGQKVTALQRVGVYVPGGKAAYPSSVLMNIVPAKVAGVEEIVMVTPPGRDGKVNPNTLVAAHEAGADVIYKVGGAQAVGALAYGTSCIPKVDKIVGPGNIYVALAKKAVYGHVSIDAIAGPSEILVIADELRIPGMWRQTFCPRQSTMNWPAPSLSPQARSWQKRCPKKWTDFCRSSPEARSFGNLWTIMAISLWLKAWRTPLTLPTRSRQSIWRFRPGIPTM